MPLPAAVMVALVTLGCIVFLVQQVKALRRRKRNLQHWEKNEPLEGVGDWD
jgi:heme/copper-type cytochrome/quinol oxidase subunit 2